MGLMSELRRLPGSRTPPYTFQIADGKGTSPGSRAEFVYPLLQLQESDGAHPSSAGRPVPTARAKL